MTPGLERIGIATALPRITMQDKKSDDLAAEDMEREAFPFLVVFTMAQIHANLTAGIEGGSQHWARVAVGPHLAGWRNYFTARFTDHHTGKIHELSLDKLKEGLGVLQSNYPRHFADILTDDGDATTGDVLIQCALLGDIVYG